MSCASGSARRGSPLGEYGHDGNLLARRQALRAARRSAPRTDTKKKLEVVRAAARHAFPTADIDSMLREIERGYGPNESR
jgi:hypothetical protein